MAPGRQILLGEFSPKLREELDAMIRSPTFPHPMFCRVWIVPTAVEALLTSLSLPRAGLFGGNGWFVAEELSRFWTSRPLRGALFRWILLDWE
jgi:hypothetical protein